MKNDSISTKQPAEMFDAEEYLNNLDIWNHPTITDIDNNSHDVAQIMADFANEYYGKNKKEEKC
jgi:hypothetical protein